MAMLTWTTIRKTHGDSTLRSPGTEILKICQTFWSREKRGLGKFDLLGVSSERSDPVRQRIRLTCRILHRKNCLTILFIKAYYTANKPLLLHFYILLILSQGVLGFWGFGGSAYFRGL